MWPKATSRPRRPAATTARRVDGPGAAEAAAGVWRSDAPASRCGTLFDGTGAAPVPDAVVVVTDGRIAAVGPSAATAVPAGAQVVDLGDRFVMPGLVDAHSHISIVPGLGDQVGQLRQPPVPQALRATANLRRDLAAGTTTLRVMAEENFLDVDVREAIEAGVVSAPACCRHPRASPPAMATGARSPTSTAWTRSGEGSARTSSTAPTS